MHKCNISSVQFIVIRMYIYANLHVILSKCFARCSLRKDYKSYFNDKINVCLCFISAAAFQTQCLTNVTVHAR